MQILKKVENIEWLLPLQSCSEHVYTDVLPSDELVTGAFVLAFKDGKILLTRVNSRGWDIPGGHTEKEETPEETMVREFYEETGAKLESFQLLGYEKVTITSPKPEGYKYPYPVSYLAYFVGKVGEMGDFKGEFETSEIGFFEPSEIEDVSWFENHKELFQKAIETM